MIGLSKQEKELRQNVIDAAAEYYSQILQNKPDFTPGDKIHYAGRVFDEKEVTTLIDSCLDFWLTSGRYVEQFERKITEFLGVRYCSLTNSGSSANLLAFLSLTIPNVGENYIRKGDEVITVAAGFPTTVAPIVQYGAVPVFVDVALPTYNIDWTRLDEALSGRTRAVMLAHTLGNPFNVAEVKKFCERNSLWLIEDNCDALGSQYCYDGKWYYTGTFGDIGTSSFYPPHHITTGEGGAVYTNSARLRKNILSLRDWGRDCWCESGTDGTCKQRFAQQFGELPLGYDHKYVYSNFGYNLKLTEMQAAIGCAQLDKIAGFTDSRRQNWQLLRDNLGCYEEFFIIPEETADSRPSWFGFPLTVRDEAPFTRADIVGFLEANNLQTRMLFAGNIISQPCFDQMRKRGLGYRVVGDLKMTDRIMHNTFWIGVYPGLTEKHIDFMLLTFQQFMSEIKAKASRS